MKKLFICLIVILGLTACGQKGALYLPDQKSPSKAPPDFIIN